MNKPLFALSLFASLAAISLSANALTQGASGLTSMTHAHTNTQSTVTGVASSSTDAVAVIQPMVQSPTVVVGKVSAMGTALNTIQPIVDLPVIN